MKEAFSGYCQRLTSACVAKGLAAAALPDSAQVRVWDPDFDRFAELISCRSTRDGVYFWWSFGGLAGPVSEVYAVAERAVRVVSPRLQGLPAGRARR